jgi:hypothetical protein
MGKRSTKTPARAPTARPKRALGAASRELERGGPAQAGGKRGRTAQPGRPPAWLAEPGATLWPALRRVPTAAWICALVACLNAVSWSFITPPFQVPDEPDHFAYVRELAEHGRLPKGGDERYTLEETTALEGVNYVGIRQHPSTHVTVSATAQHQLNLELKELNHHSAPGESTNAGVAASEPPLYYALETVPYALGSSGNLLDRLQLMRLLSSLMAGIAALFIFLFIRETLPRVRWAWTVGALAVALSPLFGFMSGGVNPDAMLFAISAALFYCIARAFRRGLTNRVGLAIGALIAAGLLTKFSFMGVVPGALVALIVLAARARRSSGHSALRAPALGAAIACFPLVLYVIRNALSNRPTFGIMRGSLNGIHGTLLDVANYDWQLYLPRLPGTANDFPGLLTTRQIWFDGFVGRLGWLDTFFPEWVYSVALVIAALIGLMCLRSLLSARAALRERTLEFAVYALMAIGLLVLVGTASYTVFPLQTASYGQSRYLLQLLPLFGVLLALAARGAGRRWGPAAGTLIVVLFLAHDLFSQLQVVSRYYG